MRDPASPLGVLRDATAAAHERIERIAVATGFMVDRDAYARYLVTTFGFYATFEPRLVAALTPVLLDAAERRKLDWLVADLAALGVAAVDAIPRCDALPSFEAASRGYVIGAGYVIEGATLGGRYISSRVVGGAAPRHACRFFEGYGPRTGAMWRAFARALEHELQDRSALDDAVRGARATFDALAAWLTDASSASTRGNTNGRSLREDCCRASASTWSAPDRDATPRP